MLGRVFLLCLIALASADRWAVLIAGSNGFWNYRHQADVSHAYQILIKSGYSPDKIILMEYNDLVNNTQNHFKGKLFNHPSSGPGKDVYQGVAENLAYSGADVTTDAFIGVLTGVPATDANGKIVGSGRVLKSTDQDEVFIYYSDHGGRGMICMPGMKCDCTAQKINGAFDIMSQKKMFKKLVFYLEACESGSIFDGLLKTPGVYALSASNPTESSWGWYCSGTSMGGDKVDGVEMGTCLGDQFSITWMEDTDGADRSSETLQRQFQNVKAGTTKSHVMQWGVTSYTSDLLKEWFPAPKTPTPKEGNHTGGSSRDAKLTFLNWVVKKVEQSNGDHPMYGSLAAAQSALAEELASRDAADKLFTSVWDNLMGSTDYGMSAYLPPRNFACMDTVREALYTHCGGFTEYSLKYSGVLVNMCERGVAPVTIAKELEKLCL
eukprot:NODE_617_length_1498_cov_131.077295_g457_i0.p1 GENE.NODE_617_length_1498_cov_131.077295_g457_i0~~NODE_617_length_1498_cov_131.077295_g457_i0.p1  ORF type:complete len:450 (+),score=120.47 NODE_617_length_1498_cov_131.077295_g457_i0:43-1350(+)